jgi:hypothetical protein
MLLESLEKQALYLTPTFGSVNIKTRLLLSKVTEPTQTLTIALFCWID